MKGIDLAGDQKRLEQLGAEHFREHQTAKDWTSMAKYLRRLGVPEGGRVLVIGCGPQPAAVLDLLDLGFDASGLEPLPESYASACQYVGVERMHLGTAEALPAEAATYGCR